MNIKCERCGQRYDDARRNTICPHQAIASREVLDRKDAAFKLIGKQVRFAHQPEGPNHRVQAISFDGMVTLDDMSGEFSPHIFVVKQ